MKPMMVIGYLVMTLAWSLLLAGCAGWFAPEHTLLMVILLTLMVMLHALQLLMFKGIMGGKLKLGAAGILEVILFGVFALWRYWQKPSSGALNDNAQPR